MNRQNIWRVTFALSCFGSALVATGPVAHGAPLPRVPRATSPKITWKTSTLAPVSTVTATTLVSTNSSGKKTWAVSGNCSIKGIKITTKSSGTCKVKLTVAAKGSYKARTSTKKMTISVASSNLPTSTTTPASNTGSLTASGCSSSVKFPDLSSTPGAGGSYAKPKVSVSCSAGTMTVTSNGMIGYAFVSKTPNGLKEQSFTWRVPTAPKAASSVTSIEKQLGTVAFTVTGIPIYGPMEGPVPPDQAFGDPVYNNLLDSCKGHTGYNADYHYHAILAVNDCYLNETVIGYANDGFSISSNPGYTYVSGYKLTGNPKSNAWDAYTYVGGGSNTLDECNGRMDADESGRKSSRTDGDEDLSFRLRHRVTVASGFQPPAELTVASGFQPPATAGMIETVSPTGTGVSRPSR